MRGILRRPASRSRSRKPVRSPSLGGGTGKRVRKFINYQGRFEAGKTQEVSVVPLSFWQFGEVYQFGGEYWGKRCNVSGRLEYITLGKAGYVATRLLRGADNPALKQWSESCHASGYPPEITVHLCPVGCPKHGMSTGGIHGLTVVKEDSSAPWAYGH